MKAGECVGDHHLPLPLGGELVERITSLTYSIWMQAQLRLVQQKEFGLIWFGLSPMLGAVSQCLPQKCWTEGQELSL